MFDHEKLDVYGVELEFVRWLTEFFDDARGSALECAACLDASVAKRIATRDRIQPGKEALVRFVAMLTKLVERFDPD
jgi:hypothetical protein